MLGTDPGFADLAALDLRPGASAPIRNAGPASTTSPAGHPFPAPLYPPSSTPPPHAPVAPGGGVARPSDGPLDAGAYEYGTGSGGYLRPKGATPVRVSLTPAFVPCATPDRRHSGALGYGSCNAVTPGSGRLTLGAPDANGQAANALGSIVYGVRVGDPATQASEADVTVTVSLIDVRRQGTLADYTGELSVQQMVQITDRFNGPSQLEPATVQASLFRFGAPCAATDSISVGGICSLQSTFNAIVPGAVVEGKRASWELGQIEVFDGGADEQAATTNDNTVFERQGLFVP
jgi:hypothetical protein